MLFEQSESRRCGANDIYSLNNIEEDQPAIHGVFPHRQFWAVSAPRFHGLWVASRALSEPFQKVQNQALDARSLMAVPCLPSAEEAAPMVHFLNVIPSSRS